MLASCMIGHEPIAEPSEMSAFLAAAGLPTDDVGKTGRSFFRFFDAEGETVGFGGLEIYDEAALVRSVVVGPTHRGRGVGAAILDAITAEAALRGVGKLYLMTTDAKTYFEQRGFEVISHQEAPASIF